MSIEGQTRLPAHAYVGREPRRLVAPVKLVEPHALEEVVRDARERRRLVQAAELDVGRDARGDVEDVRRHIRAGWFWEERVVDDRGVQGGSEEPFSQVAVSLCEVQH